MVDQEAAKRRSVQHSGRYRFFPPPRYGRRRAQPVFFMDGSGRAHHRMCAWFLPKWYFLHKDHRRDLERSDHPPNNLIMVEANRWAIDKGFHKINFGLGVLDYKMHYASSIKEYEKRVFSSTLKGHIAARLYVARRQAREWLIPA
jgi:CelD/BcsL family acetyltransferase involved in cellulose biosynthesis